MVEMRWIERVEPGMVTVHDGLGKLVNSYESGYDVTRWVLQYREVEIRVVDGWTPEPRIIEMPGEWKDVPFAAVDTQKEVK